MKTFTVRERYLVLGTYIGAVMDGAGILHIVYSIHDDTVHTIRNNEHIHVY